MGTLLTEAPKDPESPNHEYPILCAGFIFWHLACGKRKILVGSDVETKSERRWLSENTTITNSFSTGDERISKFNLKPDYWLKEY